MPIVKALSENVTTKRVRKGNIIATITETRTEGIDEVGDRIVEIVTQEVTEEWKSGDVVDYDESDGTILDQQEQGSLEEIIEENHAVAEELQIEPSYKEKPDVHGYDPLFNTEELEMSIAEIPADAPRPRHCTLKKWPDFPGFGFNLHAEKDKAGQFIGKVDDDSPAFYAGVRSGDRVVEVGEVNIGTESHSQVVQRIRNIAGEGKDVTLLLLDHEADIYYQEKDLVVNSSWANVEYHETPVPRPGTKKNENIVAGVMALEINSENEQVPEVEIPADGVVITSRTTTIYVEPEEPEEPEEIIVVVENDVESDVPVEDDDEAVVIVTVTAPEESTPVDVEPVLHDSEQTNGVEEAVNGDIEPEVVVVAESAPTPPPEAEVEEVKTEVVQVAVVETTITHVETNNIESVPEPDYIPEPEPVPEPETTIIVTTQTTVVESTPTQNDDEPKSNGEVNNMLNMSAKEYREYLKTHGKASAKNKAYNFKQKKDMFDHL